MNIMVTTSKGLNQDTSYFGLKSRLLYGLYPASFILGDLCIAFHSLICMESSAIVASPSLLGTALAS